jgi:hypothetical protein
VAALGISQSGGKGDGSDNFKANDDGYAFTSRHSIDEANVKAEIDDNWFLGGLEPTNQLYTVHLLVDG